MNWYSVSLILLALLGGLIITAFGLFSTTLWDKWRIAKKFWTGIWLLLSVAGILLGTWVSTFYWTKYFQENQAFEAQQQMVRYLMAECVLNRNLFRSRIINETNEDSLKIYVFYPPFHVDAVKAALASSLFIGSGNGETFNQLMKLNHGFEFINQRLAFMNQEMAKLPADSIREWRKALRDGRSLSEAREYMNQFGQLLVDKYHAPSDSVFFE